MAKKNQLDNSLPKIKRYFKTSDKRVFTQAKFSTIFYENQEIWKIPARVYPSQLLKYLIKKGELFEYVFSDDSGKRKEVYSLKGQDDFTIFTGLKSNAYYSYYTALYIHGLTLQIPKTFYLNFEHSGENPNSSNDNELTQETIDKAFDKEQRKSSSIFTLGDKKIILTNGKYTGKIGVVKVLTKNQMYEYTDLERTLIDISVRPVYSGGVFEVLNAFKSAKGKLNVKKMANYLNKINFIYPYHQAIGFYLEKAGYSNSELEYFRGTMKYKFYLTYNIRNKIYSENWKLYYPNGF